MSRFLRLLLCSLLTVRLAAALPLFEPFNHPAGSTLGGRATPDGLVWDRLGAGAAPQLVAATGSLSGGSGPTPTAGHASLSFSGTAGGSRLPFGTTLSSGVVYYAFLLKLSNAAPVTTPALLAAFDPLTTGAPSPTNLPARLLVRSNAAGLNLGIGRNTSANAQASWAATTYTTNDTVLVVAAYEFTAGTHRAYLWLNPAPATFGAASPPAATVTNNAGTAVAGAQISSLVFPVLAGSPSLILVDELRVGTTWAAVTSYSGPPPAGPFVETLLSNAVIHHTGTVLEADDDAITADPAYDRESIRVETRISLQNTNSSPHASTYVLSYRLLDPTGVPHPIRAFGSTTPNSSNTYSPAILVNLAAGASTNLTNFAFIRPTARLAPATPYAVECRLFRDTATFTGRAGADAPRLYFHHTNTAPADVAYNVLTRLDSLTPTREFALRSSSNSLRAFQAQAAVTLSRYDRFTAAAPAAASVPILFQLELLDVLGGTNIPLRNELVATNIPLAEYTLSGGRKSPTQLALNQLLDFEPAAGIQLDPVAGRYRFRVTVAHDNASVGAPNVVLGNRVAASDRGLLHFSGLLRAGAVVGAYTDIANTPANLGPNAPGIATSVAFPPNNGILPGSPLRFGNGTPVSVRLRTDGSVDLLAASIPLTGGAAATSNVIQRIAYTVGSPTLRSNGVAADVTVQFPSGFGSRLGNRNQPFSQGSATFANVLVDPSTLAPTVKATLNAPAGQSYFLSEESKPVWFEAASFSWDPPAGRISFVPTAVHHVRKNQYASPAGSDIGTSAYTPSNDRYWEFVSHVTSVDVGITADASGRAQATFAVALTTSGTFEPHFPAETTLAWTGGASLTFSNDFAVPSLSTFNSVSNVVIHYSVGCRDCGFVPTVGIGETQERKMELASGLRLTVDGGLAGAGTTPIIAPDTAVVRDLGWGKSAGGFTHTVERVNEGRFHMPGTFLGAQAVATNPAAATRIPGSHLAGILLLTGVDAAQGTAVARPLGTVTNELDNVITVGNAGYMAGLGDYAGMNYTPTSKLNSAVDPRAISWIAGQKVEFDPSGREKLYLRRSGVTGIHESATLVTLNNLYGYQFAVSNLSLAFLGGQNSESGLSGGITLPYPADFSYTLNGILLRCNGHLDGAPRSSGVLGVRLNYWNTHIIVNGVTFEPVSIDGSGRPFLPDCDSTEYSLVFDISFSPGNEFVLEGFDTFTGRVGFGTDGNILPASAGIAGVDSRLAGPTTLELKGANDENYAFEPVTDSYFNTYKSNYGTSSFGWFNLAGKLDVAFFQDLKVHMHISPGSNLGTVYMMGGWPASGFDPEPGVDIWQVSGNDYFNDPDFDADNDGKPNIQVDTYRDSATEDYNPRAQKTWAEIIKFDYPLVWSTSAKEFSGLEAKERNLLILETFSRLDHLRANEADLAFGARYSAVPIANLTEMLLEGSGLNDALQDAVGAQLDYMDKGLGELGDILDSDPHKFWDPILDAALDPVLADLYEELEELYATVEPCQFATQARATVEKYIEGTAGGANSVAYKLSTIAGQASDLATAIGQTDKWLADVEVSIDAVIGTVSVPGGIGEPAGEVAGILAEAITDAAYKPRSKTKEMATDILAKMVGIAADIAVQELVEELLENEDIPLDQIAVTLVDLRAAISDIRAGLQPAGQYAAQIALALNAVSSQITSLTELATEDVLDYLESFACGIDDPFLDVAETAFKDQLKEFIKDRFYETGIPAAVQDVLKELLYDLNSLLVDAVNSGIAVLNRVLEQVLTDTTINAVSEAVPLLGDLASALGAGSITGDAHIVGDNLSELRLDTEMEFGFNGSRGSSQEDEGSVLKLGVGVRIKSLNNEGEDGTCSAGSVPATEVTVAFVAQAAEFLTDGFQIQGDFLVAFSNDPSADPPFKVLQLGGGFEVPVYIPIIPGLLTLENIGGDASFGKFEDYISANCDVNVIELVTVTGGVFIGKTCDHKPFDTWAKDIQNLLPIGPDGWAGIYTETSATYALGTEGCWLRAEMGGGIGFGFGWNDPKLFGRIHGHVDGDFLCFIHGGAWFELNARGDLGDALNGDFFGALWAKGCAGVEVKIVVSATHEVCITYRDGTFEAE